MHDVASLRVFTPNCERVEVMLSAQGGQGLQTCAIENLDSLDRDPDLKIHRRSDRVTVYLIPREYSWGRLRISQEAFERVFLAHSIFAAFLDVVADFGSRINEDHYIHSSYNARIYPSSESQTQVHCYEICYKLQYVELNGRGRGDPWSLRQVGIYQQVSLETRRSIWVLLNPPEKLRAKLQQDLGEPYIASQCPMKFHATSLSCLGRNWVKYVQDLLFQLATLDEKACFSRVPRHCQHDYSVSFEDCQALHLLRNKAHQASAILQTCLEIARGCQDLCRDLDAFQRTSTSEQTVKEVELYVRDLLSCKRNVDRMIQRSQDTAYLLSRILEARSIKSLQDANIDILSKISIIDRTVSASHRENITISAMAQEGRKTSDTFKALTMIATMYLPATLVATVFSSSLIQWHADNSQNGSTTGSHYAVVPQFWIFVICTLVLMVLTLVGARVIEGGFLFWSHRRSFP